MYSQIRQVTHLVKRRLSLRICCETCSLLFYLYFLLVKLPIWSLGSRCAWGSVIQLLGWLAGAWMPESLAFALSIVSYTFLEFSVYVCPQTKKLLYIEVFCRDF